MKISDIVESRGHKVIAGKLADIERKKEPQNSKSPAQMRAEKEKEQKEKEQKANEGVEEGLGKTIKRVAQGWGGNNVTPQGIKSRAGEYTDAELKDLQDQHRDLIKSRASSPMPTDPNKHSPAGLQQRIINRELKKRGVAEGSDEIQLQDKKIYTFLRAISNWWNDKTPKNRISYDGPGMRVWTRGDGTRMRDPAKLTSSSDDSIEMLWDSLSKLPGVKPAGAVSHEFPSLGSNDAIVFKGFILVKRAHKIDVMSRSRVKNPNSVWKQTQADKPLGQGVEEGSLKEFAPAGFNSGDEGEEFNPRMAKMAHDEGIVKGASLADVATLARAMAINHWDSHDGGIYKHHFAKGFKEGRMDKIRHDNKQYNLNLKLMKDGSIRHGEQGVEEGDAPKMVQDRKTSKQYDPKAEFDKLLHSPETRAQMTRMGQEKGKGWPERKK